MNITNKIVTTTAQQQSAIADYTIEYMVENDILVRVHATVKEKDSNNVIGQIYLENESLGATFSKLQNVAPYFEEFDTYYASIKSATSPSLMKVEQSKEITK